MLRTFIIACVCTGFVSSAAAEKVDATGWTLLGTQRVKGERDRDVIRVGNHGVFDELRIVVDDADVEMSALTVVFANGKRWSPKLQHRFRDGQRSAPIDLPGNDRAIAKIELRYAAAKPGDMAEVMVYGRDRRKTTRIALAKKTKHATVKPRAKKR